MSENDPAFRSVVQLIAISQVNGEIYECSGAFIAPTLVVTAAHCMIDDQTGRMLKNFKFYVHRGNLEGDWLKTVGQDQEVWATPTELRYNRAYGTLIHNNDIALVKVRFKKTATPIVAIKPLLTTDFMQPETKVRFLGSGPPTAEDARKKRCTYRVLGGAITGRIVPQWGMVEVRFIGDAVASGEPELSRVGLDFGDSGGPSLVTLPDGVEYLWAVESQAEQFISLGHHRTWILKTARAMGVNL